MISEHLPILAVVLPLVGALTVLLAGWAERRYCYPVAVAVLTVQFGLSLAILREVLRGGTIHYYLGDWAPPWGIELVVDHLSAYVLVILVFLSLLSCIYAKRSMRREIDPQKTVAFYVMFLLLVVGVCGITVTGDIFNLYVFLEISSIAAYTLVASGREKKGLLAGFNYLIMGTISACFILIGIGHLYVVTGTLNMADLAQLLPPLYDSTIIHVAFIFFIVGLSIKTALFPLHTWLPDAYSHAPSAISVLISTVISKMGIYATIRILFSVFTVGFIVDHLPILEFFAWVAAIAVIAGSVIAIAQTDLKRMLAYSSVSQMGYIMLGIGIANSVAMTGGVLHILNHALIKGCLFMVAGAIIYRVGLRKIDDFKGLAGRMPYTCAAFFIAAISMIGLPPTVGFMSKWYLTLGAIEAGEWFFVVVILASTLLNAIYFWRVLEYAYFRHADAETPELESRVPVSMLVPMLVLAAGCVVFFFAVSIPLGIIDAAVADLLGGA